MIADSEQINEVLRPVVIKAQVLSGGRGKAGGIRSASNTNEARLVARQIMDLKIGGQPVKNILIEEKVPALTEIYFAIALDRSLGLPILMVSQHGGMDIESVPETAIFHWTIHPFIGIRDYLLREVNDALYLQGNEAKTMSLILERAWALFRSMDCDLLEVNPLIASPQGRMVAADAKISIDSDALFRHPELKEMGEEELSPLEIEARERGITLVQLEGNIGVIANGAGLTMATLDNLSAYGGRGGTFMDLGGTDDPEKVKEAFELIARINPRVILLNIFGGITKCDTVAKGVLDALHETKTSIPVVARIRGVNEDLARRMLSEAGLAVVSDLDEACKRASELGGSA